MAYKDDEEGEYPTAPWDSYDAEESEAKRNPKPPMTSEEHAEYMSLYADDEDYDTLETPTRKSHGRMIRIARASDSPDH